MEPTTHEITDKAFFSGGKAYFTIRNPEGKYYTYQISRPKQDPFCPFFIRLFVGPDNMNSFNYKYMGIYNPEDGSIRVTKKSKYKADSLPVKVAQWAIKLIHQGKPIPPGYRVHHDGRCCRCGRRLTTPQSVERGIGPECIKLVGADKKK